MSILEHVKKLLQFKPRFIEMAQEIAKSEGLEPLTMDAVEWLWNSFVQDLFSDKRRVEGWRHKQQ